MPAWLLRFLPHALAVVAILGAMWWLDDRGYQRAKADQAALELRLAEKIADSVMAIDQASAARLAALDTAQRTIVQPIITKEIASDPRFSDPSAGVTGGMRDAINRARAASAAPGANSQPVPAAPDAH